MRENGKVKTRMLTDGEMQLMYRAKKDGKNNLCPAMMLSAAGRSPSFVTDIVF